MMTFVPFILGRNREFGNRGCIIQERAMNQLSDDQKRRGGKKVDDSNPLHQPDLKKVGRQDRNGPDSTKGNSP